MKKTLVSLMKRSGERAAEVPVAARSIPGRYNQPKMPLALREKMEKLDKK